MDTLGEVTDKESVLVFVLVFCAGLFVLSWVIRKAVDVHARGRIEQLKRALDALDKWRKMK